jgi:hypothetical protein
MKLDRTRFLMLTTAISGAIAACTVGACSVNSTTNNGPGGGDGSTGDDGATGNDGSTTHDGSGEASTNDGGNEATTCDDSVGSAGACADYADGGTGPADAGDGGSVCLSSAFCDSTLANLKPKVAQAAIACVVALPTCESGAGIDTCVETALAGACADTTGKAACDQIASVCGDAGADAGVSPADCQKYTAGLTAAGRTAFVACMTESACFITDAKQCFPQL